MDDIFYEAVAYGEVEGGKSGGNKEFTLEMDRSVDESKLKRKGDLTPDELRAFISECERLYELPEVIQALRASKLREPQFAINALQKNVLRQGHSFPLRSTRLDIRPFVGIGVGSGIQIFDHCGCSAIQVHGDRR